MKGSTGFIWKATCRAFRHISYFPMTFIGKYDTCRKKIRLDSWLRSRSRLFMTITTWIFTRSTILVVHPCTFPYRTVGRPRRCRGKSPVIFYYPTRSCSRTTRVSFSEEVRTVPRWFGRSLSPARGVYADIVCRMWPRRARHNERRGSSDDFRKWSRIAYSSAHWHAGSSPNEGIVLLLEGC